MTLNDQAAARDRTIKFKITLNYEILSTHHDEKLLHLVRINVKVSRLVRMTITYREQAVGTGHLDGHDVIHY